MKRFRLQARTAVVACVAVIAAGCGSAAGLSPTAASPSFSAGEIAIEPAGAIVGTAVAFECRGASNPAGDTLYYSWDFGDGSTGSGEATTHVYSTAGSFVVTVTVRSHEAGSAQASRSISVAA